MKKILYTASDRRDAQQAAFALGGLGPNVAIAWTPSLSTARPWIHENRNVAVLIVEIEADHRGCESFVGHARSLGITAPVIVVAVGRPDQPLTLLNTAADEIIPKDQSFLANLPAVVARALEAGAAGDPEVPALAGDAGPAWALGEQAGDPTEPHPFAQAVQARDELEQQLGDALAELEQAQQAREADAARVADLERRLADAEAALHNAVRHDAAQRPADSAQPALAVADASGRHPHADAALASDTTMRQALEQRLADMTLALERTEDRHAAEMKEADARLADQRTRAEERASEAAAALDALQVKLVDEATALQRTDQRAAAERQAAAEEAARRLSTVETELIREAANRRVLEKAVFAAEAARLTVEQQHAAELAAATERLGEAERTGAARVAEVVGALEARLAAAAQALKRVETQAADDRRRATDADARRQAAFETQLAEEATKARAAADRLRDAEAAVRRAGEMHASEMARVAARLDEQRAHGEEQLSHAASALNVAQTRLIEQAEALQRTEQEAAERQATLGADLAREIATRQTLTKQLEDAQAAHRLADERHTFERADAARQRAVDTATFEATLAQEVARRQTLAEQLEDVRAAARRAGDQRALEVAAAAEQTAERQATFEAELARQVAIGQMLARELEDAQAASRRAAERRTAELAAAAKQATERQTTFEAALAVEAAARQALATELEQAQTAFQHARERHTFELVATAAELADYQKQAVASLAETTASAKADRARLEDQYRQEMALVTARLAEYQADAEAHLGRDAAALEALRSELTHANAVLIRTVERATAEREAAAETAAERQVAFDAELAQQVAMRQALEAALTEREAARHLADEQHTAAMAAAATRLEEFQLQGEAQLAQVTADAAAALQISQLQAHADRDAAARQLAERETRLTTELGQEVARRESVERELTHTRAAAEQAQRRFLDGVNAMRDSAREHEIRLEEHAARERVQWEATLAEREERIGHLQSEGDLIRQSLVAREEQFQRLHDLQKQEHASVERARVSAEHELARQRADYAALQEAAEQTRTNAERALEQFVHDRARERAEFEALVASRDAALQDHGLRARRSDEAAAKAMTENDGLRKQADDSQAERRRQFNGAPVSMCCCGRDGTISQATAALAGLLGYSSAQELEHVDFAKTVFESADELGWLIDRCLASRATESIETTWTKKDGSRMLVRIAAVARTSDLVDLAATDITALRELEDKLRLSQRHEAVARYASEVAVTCENLLSDVSQQGQQWLARIDSGIVRHQGELLLSDVSRASAFLRQLSAYGDKQREASTTVDVSQVLRDLGSVLKRVAGDNIELVLPTGAKPLNLDVESERVERILVNIAAYARGRMPLGGRLMIEVAAVDVDRTFAEKYPSVRPGAHALLTVTEQKATETADWTDAASAVQPPGVDLGVLQALVSDCGGHLWIAAEPSGDMVLKIHLPRRTLEEQPAEKRPGRWINRLAAAARQRA